MIEISDFTVHRSIDIGDPLPLTINFELYASSDENPIYWVEEFKRMTAIERMEGAYDLSYTDIYNYKSAPFTIHIIYHNPQKRTTVVLFKTGRFIMTNGKEHYFRIKVKRDSEDLDDIYMAVASAVMIKKYKTNSQFKAHLRRSTPKGVAEIPGIYQVAAAYETSEIYGSWENFCKIVDEKVNIQ